MKAFTLIELLVVVTIIVVLLALLTPALDRAIQQAELALCGANQKAIATGANVYAMSQRRTYPDRKAINTSGQAVFLNDASFGNIDDRPLLKEYMPMDALADPLADEIGLDPSETQPSSSANGGIGGPYPWVGSGYQLFFDWKYLPAAGGGSGMTKPGGRFSWTGTTNLYRTFPAAKTWTFDVLVSDQNSMTYTGNGGAITSHPDEDGVLAIDTMRNKPYPSGTAVAGFNEGYYFVHSRWGIANTSTRRGKFEVNSARSDGSVSRMSGVEWDEEERVTSAPIGVEGAGTYNYWLNLPTR